MRRFAAFLLALLACLSLAACGTKEEVPQQKEPEALLFGTVYGVITENGEPVEGVTVTAGERSARTDGEGKYTVPVYDGGTTLVFTKDGYFTQKKTFKSSSFYADEIEYSFLMFRKARVSGVVTLGGEPVLSAKVTLGLQETETDAQGAFVFEEVIATSMILIAEKDGRTARKPLYTEEMRTGSVTAELDLEA